MPAQARSLRITEAYRGRMAGLRDRAKAEAKRTWAKVDIDALDDTWNPGMLVLATTQLQREAARLSAGYLAAYVSSEKGERVELPPAVALDAGKVWTGSSLTKAFRGAVIGTKIQIADGKPAADAYVEGGQALVQTAGLAVDDVCRESLRIAMEGSSDVTGYVRAVKGTCQACMGAADGVVTSVELPLSIHPNCVCVSEPQISTRDQGVRDARKAVDQVVTLPRQPKGFRDLSDSDSATARYNRLDEMIETHPDASAKSASNSVVHELGHFLDDRLTSHGGGISREGEFGIAEGRELMAALENSQSIRSIADDAVKILEGDPETKAYLLKNDEMFARAFHQYVAMKTRNPVLMKKIEGDRDFLPFMVWSEDDFAPIARAFDKLLKSKGVLK